MISLQGPGRSASTSWAEAARRLESLTPTEVRALSSHSAEVLSRLISRPLDTSSPTWEALFSTAVTAITTPKLNSSSRPLFSTSLGHISPFLIQARGFKSRARGGTETGFSSFNRLKRGQAEAEKSTEDKKFKEVLNKLNISPEEKEKVHIALLSYATGAQGEGEKKSEETGTGKQASRFNISGNLWMYLNRLATLLVIVAITISLTQIYGLPSLSRMSSKLANEIAPEDIDVTFDDVKGCDEAKQELRDVVEFLMNPDKFSALGGKLPKGCLLVGPPGTGKTLLARAVAGEAGVPFFYASGSEFDEVLVGQGARRVRDLFKAAKERAPCVIFLDEIDSVGGKRSSSDLHPYANQTINQLLNEMDGFVSNEGVIVLGATNMRDHLDKALLRPGRFDNQVEVGKPDIKGRREILHLYLSKIKHDDSIDVESIASRTTGFAGADLQVSLALFFLPVKFIFPQNLVNTATIHAATENKDSVGMSDFEWAYDKQVIPSYKSKSQFTGSLCQVMGTEWKSRVRPREDLEITAYHEAGHTLVALLTKDAMPLHKVTILAKGQSGGHTGFTIPENMQWHETKAQMLANMDVSMGGRIAEELIFGKEKITGGASSDLSSATRTAVSMVKKLGMSEKVGLRVQYDDPVQNMEYGPSTREVSFDWDRTILYLFFSFSSLMRRSTACLTSHTNAPQTY